MSVEIAYTGTEQRENHETMILHGISTPPIHFGMDHTIRMYIIDPSSQFSKTFFCFFMRRVSWVVLTSDCVSPNVMPLI